MKKMIFLASSISLFFLLLTCAPITEIQKPLLTDGGEEVENELAILSKVSATLAQELRRLPELKRGLDEKGVLVLKRIVTFYTQSPNPDEVKQIFNKILSIGKREYRKFSAPLQALLWVAEENELPLGQNPLKIFSKETKEKYISSNWKMYGPDFRYMVFNKNLGEDEDVIIFVCNIWEKTYYTDKWKDPNEIIERLNSPHLFDLFFRDNIRYDWEKVERYKSSGFYLKSVKETIKSRKGTCSDATNFAMQVLRSSGYKVIPLNVHFREPASFKSIKITGHTVAVLEEGGKLYKIADHPIQNRIVGPFESIKEIAEQVAKNCSTTMEDYSLSLLP